MPRTPDSCDVAIVGGGLTGASLAAALASSELEVVLIEAAAPPKSTPAWDERCIAINAASRRIFEALGVWQALEPEAAAITSTHISERGRFGIARFTAAEAGLPALGYNVPLRAIGAALWKTLGEGGVDLRCPARVQALEVRDGSATLDVDGDKLSARLVVACDGAHSVIRGFLGIGAQESNYGQTAIVGAVRAERPQAGVAWERFTPDGPIAVLPRPDGCGLIWTVPTSSAAEMLAWDDATFLANLQEAFGRRLGRLLEVGRRNGHPLTRTLADAITAERVAFAGNAAQTLHPVAAQGFNLGLRDVATLAELLAGASDPGADEVLAEYARRRDLDRSRVSGFTDGLVRIFSNTVPGLSEARHWGLLALDLLPPVKDLVMRQNLGFGGVVPAMARRAR